MTVVSDTSPLRYLAALGGLEWLNHLFGEIACPPEVMAECRHDFEKELARLRAQSNFRVDEPVITLARQRLAAGRNNPNETPL